MGRNMIATMDCTTRKAQLHPSGVYKVMDDVYMVERPRGCTVRSHLIDPNMQLKTQLESEIFEYCWVKEHRWRPDWAPFYPPSKDLFVEYLPLLVKPTKDESSTCLQHSTINATQEGFYTSVPKLVPHQQPYKFAEREAFLEPIRTRSRQEFNQPSGHAPGAKPKGL